MLVLILGTILIMLIATLVFYLFSDKKKKKEFINAELTFQQRLKDIRKESEELKKELHRIDKQ